MKREVIKKMIEIAGSERAGDLSYDLKALEGYDGEFLWIVYGKSCTRLVKCSGKFILDSLNRDQASKYYYARNGWKLDVPDWGEPKCYWYYSDVGNFLEIDLEQAEKFSSWAFDNAVKEWEQAGNSFPSQLTVGSIRFMCDANYVQEQLEFAEKHNDDSLKNIFEGFKNRPRCNDSHEIVVSKDFAERSFIFTELIARKPVLNGGIIYHGYSDEGYQENHSVQLRATFGWSTHT